jgi:hypothetical protein
MGEDAWTAAIHEQNTFEKTTDDWCFGDPVKWSKTSGATLTICIIAGLWICHARGWSQQNLLRTDSNSQQAPLAGTLYSSFLLIKFLRNG